MVLLFPWLKTLDEKGQDQAHFFHHPGRHGMVGLRVEGHIFLSLWADDNSNLHTKNSLVSMWDAWCILLSDLETMSQCSIDNMHIVQPSGPKDQCFSLKFNQTLLAYLFPNTAISVLALMGVVSLHVSSLLLSFSDEEVIRDYTDKSINIYEKLLTTTSNWEFLIYVVNLHFRQAIKTSTPCVSHHPPTEGYKFRKGPQIHKQPHEKKKKMLDFQVM